MIKLALCLVGATVDRPSSVRAFGGHFLFKNNKLTFDRGFGSLAVSLDCLLWMSVAR